MPALPVRQLLALAAAATFGATGLALAAGAQAQARVAGPATQNRDFAVYEPAKASGGACAPVAVISRGLGVGQAPMRSLDEGVAHYVDWLNAHV